MLDEFPEFPRNVLEALRQPLEEGIVTVSRARGTFTFPAKFILVAAQNPCPCGYYGDSVKRCTCTSSQIQKYTKKISGPLLDRIDLHIEVPRLSYDMMNSSGEAEKSSDIKQRVEKARHIQHQRFGGSKVNSEMTTLEVKQYCVLDEPSQNLLKLAMDKYHLSGRVMHRLLKVARTIADIKQNQAMTVDDLAEAMQYRPKQEYG